MQIDPNIKGFSDLKKKVKLLIGESNATANMRIQRSGSQDTITVSGGTRTINLKQITAGGKAGASATGNDGIYIYKADGSTEFIDAADILADYDASTDDDWSLEFDVTTNALDFTTAPRGVSDTDRYTLDGSDVQTEFRIPVIRTITIGGDDIKKQWDITGIYRENIYCAGSDGAIVELIKVG